MNVLVLAGHLDDSVIAVGGLIRKIVNGGGQVDVVCFGNSDEDFDDVANQKTCVAKISAQAEEAHRILGVRTFTCFQYPDYGVQENRETYRLCIESIRKHKPDVILGHYWAEYFQHRAMARLACDAWWQAGWNVSADLGTAWMAKALYHFEVIQPFTEPTDIIDISDTFDAKMKAWMCFQSSSDIIEETGQPRQYGGVGSLTDKMAAMARFRGSQIGVRYGEALLRSAYLPRPVTDVSVLADGNPAAK